MMSIEAMEWSLVLETPISGEEIHEEAIELKSTGEKLKLNAQMVLVRPNMCGSREDVRTYKDKALRAATLIYAHFKKEFRNLPSRFSNDL